MTGSEVVNLVVGTVQGLGGIVILLLVLMIGLCLLVDFTKFRPTRRSLTVKSLDDLVGDGTRYLPPDTPRGEIDQLAGTRRAS